MKSEKVKEIKELFKNCDFTLKHCGNCVLWKDEDCIETIKSKVLTLINELEAENKKLHRDFVVKAYDKLRAENKQLRTANKLYAVELGKKGKQEYENIITDVRIDTLKDFREKYKEALKQEVNGENVDCFVESLKIFDKTLKEFINE